MIVAVLEPNLLFIVEPPMYLREHEIIHSELRALRYLVRIRIVEVQDWCTLPTSPDDGSLDDSDDSNDPDWLDRSNRGRSAPWSCTFHHANGNSGGGAGNDVGGATQGDQPEPHLGLGHGPTFRAVAPLQVGRMLCPIKGILDRPASSKLLCSVEPRRKASCPAPEFE